MTRRVVAFTGHRPERLGEGLSQAKDAVRQFLEEENPLLVISGMAQGVDMFAFEHCLDLKIPVVAALPWFGHGNNWPEEHRDHFYSLLPKAAYVEVVCDTEKFVPWVYQKRDEWMVDNCVLLAAVWDGQKKSGTYNTIRYAERVGREIRYLQWR